MKTNMILRILAVILVVAVISLIAGRLFNYRFNPIYEGIIAMAASAGYDLIGLARRRKQTDADRSE